MEQLVDDGGEEAAQAAPTLAERLQAFNESGLKKLPTVRGLQDEYGELLTQKKSDYREYIAVREEMRQLQRIKYACYHVRAEEAAAEHHHSHK